MENIMNKTMGTIISEARKEKNLTQADLATAMNVTDKAVSKWERDITCPDINSIPKLAEILGIEVETLVSGKAATQKNNNLFEKVCTCVSFGLSVGVVILTILDKFNLSKTEIKLTDLIGLLALAIVGIALPKIKKLNENK